MEDKIAKALGGEDYYAAATTQIAALIAVVWISMKIFSFWRMIASLFILPGTKVS